MRKSVLASVRVSGRTIQHPPSSGTDVTASSHRCSHRPPNQTTTPIFAVPHSHLIQDGPSSHHKSTPNKVSPKFWNPKRNMPRLLTWRTLSGPPFFSSKRALRGPGVIKNRGYMVQRWVQENGGSVPINVDPQVFRNRTNIQAITRSGRERRKGGDPDKNGSQLSNRFGTLLSSESIYRKSGSHV